MTSLPVTWLTWGGAILPILLLLTLMVGWRWSAVSASWAGMIAAFLIAVLVFDAGAAVLLVETGKGVWNSVPIIAVVVPAILLYEISRQADVFAVMQREFARLFPDRLLRVLAVGWCFSSFLQGPTGFGVPIAVTAPIMLAIGVRPLWAVVVPLVGHAWGNTFGTLALAWDALVQQTSLGVNPVLFHTTALWTAVFTGMVCLVSGAAVCWFHSGLKGVRHGLPALAVLGLIMVGGQVLLSRPAPTLAEIVPTTLAMGAVFLIARLPRYRRGPGPESDMFADTAEQTADAPDLTLHGVFLPYYVLVAVSVLVLLTPPLRQTLGAWSMSFAFPQTATGLGFVNTAQPAYGPVAWLIHSSFFLLITCAVAYGFFSAKGLIRPGSIGLILANSLKKSLPSSLSVLLLVIMAKVMTGSGQVEVLARGAAGVTGQYYAFLAPFIGALGAFVASSNTSSNILFGQFQENMARLTDSAPGIFLAAQTGGAADGCMFSPSKVLLGTTTTGIIGAEGRVIRKLIGLCVAFSLLMGIVAWVFA
ncbi:MAG: L-lactate permease [Methylobacteriaceae bacterium]|jgi:lactate permease|nr:L-lactate permease [Methylobacteriaceae bacterium]